MSQINSDQTQSINQPLEVIVSTDQVEAHQTITIENRVDALALRVKELENEKKKDKSVNKTVILTLVTYVIAFGIFSFLLKSDTPFRDSTVPTAGYMVSRLPVPKKIDLPTPWNNQSE